MLKEIIESIKYSFEGKTINGLNYKIRKTKTNNEKLIDIMAIVFKAGVSHTMQAQDSIAFNIQRTFGYDAKTKELFMLKLIKKTKENVYIFDIILYKPKFQLKISELKKTSITGKIYGIDKFYEVKYIDFSCPEKLISFMTEIYYSDKNFREYDRYIILKFGDDIYGVDLKYRDLYKMDILKENKDKLLIRIRKAMFLS
jgi:hypothetical protein